MEMTVDRLGEIAVVTLKEEELDAGNAGDLKSDMSPVLAANSKVVFDLERLRFIDSSGLGALLSCLRHLNARGGDLKLCGISKPVRALFELVRMHRIFDIYAAREDAVRAFQSGASSPAVGAGGSGK